MSRAILLTALVLILLVPLPGVAQGKKPADDTIEAPFWTGATALDPRPDLPMWKKAVPVSFQHDYNGDPYVDHLTTVRAVWTPDTLWLLFSCGFDRLTISPNARADIETDKLWNLSDVAEAFIAPNPADVMRYREFEVSPSGEWVDLAVDRAANKYDLNWNSGFRVAARIDNPRETWWAVMAIPLAAFDAPTPASGTRWRLNFFRYEQGPPKRPITWQPPHNPNFHTPQAFGWLVFRK
jgi:hypothetical protein